VTATRMGVARRRRPAAGIIAAAALLVCVAAAVPAQRAQSAPAWPDTFIARVEALALMQSLNAGILGSTSATLTLETWCREHKLADDPTIVAHLVKGADRIVTAEQRQRLHVTGQDAVRFRHVRLQCGTQVLSEADNWYVPARLTADMNRQLDTTDTPFGKVVRPLEPYRQTFSVKMLWSPLPEGWERGLIASTTSAVHPTKSGDLVMPDALFEHRAVLYTSAHQPFAEVDEVYQKQILAFPQPRSSR
jgi:chorismate-pyruvate lyase